MSPRFDEDVLGDPARIAAGDPGDVLRALAGAGAHVRRAVTVAPEWITEDLTQAGAPRSLLIADDAPGSMLADVLGALGARHAPVLAWADEEPPRWAGPGDALLVASADGWRPRLSRLVELAGRRGMVTAVVAPAQTPLEAAARQSRAALAHVAPLRSARADMWTLLAPLLQAAHALGAAAVPPSALLEAADALDDVAASCSPASDAITNPAKLLALELGESRTIVAGAGRLGAAAARRLVGALGIFAGEPALFGALPDDSGALSAVLDRREGGDGGDGGGGDLSDLFRDRVEDPIVPQRLLIVDDLILDGLVLDERSRSGGDPSAATLEGAARVARVRSSVLPAPGATPLARFAAATSLGDFAAVYLALLRGVDPGAPRPAEVADLYRAGRP